MSIKERKYPLAIEKDGDGFMATFGGCCGVASGKTVEGVIANARMMLNEIFLDAIDDKEEIGRPDEIKEDQPYVTVPSATWVKYILKIRQIKTGTKRVALARKIGKHEQQLDRILDIANRSTGLDDLDAVARALGKRLDISLVDIEEAA